jgi:hypothetical protein
MSKLPEVMRMKRKGRKRRKERKAKIEKGNGEKDKP